MFLTNYRPAIRTLSDGLNDPAGALNTSKWTVVAGETPDDIDATGTDIREPSTADTAPQAYLNGWEIPRGRTRTFRYSGSVKTADRDGAGSFITLYRQDLGETAVIVSRCGILDTDANATVDAFQFSWRGQISNVSISGLNINTYYRVGIELDLLSGVARGYLNTTPDGNDDTFDPGLEVRASFNIDSGTSLYDGPNAFGIDGQIFAGLDLSGAPLAGVTYSGVENLKLEEWRIPFSADFPRSTFFEVQNTPYTFYKTSIALFDRLNNARLEV